MTGSRLVRRRPGALALNTLRGVLLLAPGAVAATSVSSPGDIVWQLLAEPARIDDLVDRLAGVFDAPEATVRADLDGLLAELEHLGVIEITTRQPG